MQDFMMLHESGAQQLRVYCKIMNIFYLLDLIEVFFRSASNVRLRLLLSNSNSWQQRN